jgi:hypothetical protein
MGFVLWHLPSGGVLDLKLQNEQYMYMYVHDRAAWRELFGDPKKGQREY